VPWTGFDLINAFNAWKKTEPAGRVFTVTRTGETEVAVTGLAWRLTVGRRPVSQTHRRHWPLGWPGNAAWPGT
jgi:hypothetical protein